MRPPARRNNVDPDWVGAWGLIEPALAAVTLCAHTAPARLSRAGSRTPRTPAMAARTATRLAAVALALVLLVLVWGFTPISGLTNPEAVTSAMGAVAASPWRFAIVLGCYLVAGIIVFPVLLLMFACAA